MFDIIGIAQMSLQKVQEVWAWTCKRLTFPDNLCQQLLLTKVPDQRGVLRSEIYGLAKYDANSWGFQCHEGPDLVPRRLYSEFWIKKVLPFH